MIKEYMTLKDGKFPAPYDTKGQKIILEEKRAALHVEKGEIELMHKEKKPTKKKDSKK